MSSSAPPFLTTGEQIDVTDLPSSLSEASGGKSGAGRRLFDGGNRSGTYPAGSGRSKNLQQAAAILKLDPTTLLRKRKSLNL
jgi:transcriptional regulator of acetoin/glycerol metabolism